MLLLPRSRELSLSPLRMLHLELIVNSEQFLVQTRLVRQPILPNGPGLGKIIPGPVEMLLLELPELGLTEIGIRVF